MEEDGPMGLNSTTMANDTTKMATLPLSEFTRYLMIGLGALIIVVNVASIVMVVRARHLQPSVRYGIVSLCVSDCMVGLIMLMTRLWTSDSLGGRRYCQIQVVLFLTAFVASGLTLVLLSLERCLATVRPIRFRVWVTRERKLGALAGIWVFSLAFSCLIFYEEPGDMRPKQACLVVTYSSQGLATAWTIIVFTGYIVIFFSYAIILYRLCRRRRQIADTSNGSTVRTHQQTVSSQDRKSLVTIGVLVLVTAVGYLPATCVVAWILHKGWYVWLPEYNATFQIVTFLIVGNSLINPIIYVWQTVKIQSLICCRERTNAAGNLP